jgi:GDPmannose 4,6-dehydratase
VKIAVIFGVGGQDGFYLTKLLESKNVKVIGVSRKTGDYKGDVAEYDFVKSIINNFKPDYIFHLAANSSTNHDALFENHNTISTGTLNILEVTKVYSRDSIVFLSGSAMQFRNDGTPIDESSNFDSLSCYAVSRIHSVYLGRYYRKTFGMRVYVGFLFNHDSPLRNSKHINKKIVDSVIRIYKGANEKLEIGNLKVKKEFNFAGDIVTAIWILINQSTIFEAVIGSGNAYSIEDWVKYCFAKFDLNWEQHVVINAQFKNEYEVLVSRPNLIKSLGWIPQLKFTELADIMIEGSLKSL